MSSGNVGTNQVSAAAIPLRRSLQFRAGLLVTASVLLLAVCGIVFGLQPMTGAITRSQFSLAVTHVAAGLDGVFEPAKLILKMSHGWIGDRAPDLDQPDAFNRRFRPVLMALPQSTSIVAGTSAGEGWMLLQQVDGSWLSRMTDLERWGDRHHFFEVDRDGTQVDYWRTVTYDPRQRAWYAAAMQDRTNVQWTAPYTFFTTGDPGITASTYIPLADGRDFVLGIDLMLRDLSVTTMNARIGGHGMALVLTDDFRVLALPVAPPGVDRSQWLGKVLKPAADLGIAALSEALANWSATSGGEVSAFRANGGRWLAHAQTYALGDRQLWLLALAPESDFSPDWLSLSALLLLGLGTMLLPVMFLARQQAARLASPLETLAAASQRIGQLDFASLPTVATGIEELDQLAHAHAHMRDLLRDNQQRIAAQERELREQIEALRVADNKIIESEEYNRLLFADAHVAMTVLDPQTGLFVDCNPAAARVYRFPDRQAVIGRSPADVSAPFQPDGTPSIIAINTRIRQALEDGAFVFDWRHRHPDGSEWDGEVYVLPFRQRGQLLLQLTLHDITERRRAEQKLQLAASVFTHAREGILITTADGTIIDVNESFARITGFRRDEAIGSNPRLLASGRHKKAFYQAMWNNLKEKGHWDGEIWDRRKNGEVYAAMLTISGVRNANGHIQHYAVLFSDITALKTHQKQLEHIAHFDALTTLPNRVLLADRLHQAMAQGPRRGQLLAVAYLDLDGFKTINDRHGHEVGDQLLIALASRMKTALREGDTLARLGGDEFVAVLLDLDNIDACLPMLTRLLAAAAQPIPVANLMLKVSASLGVTFYPQTDEVDADQLLRQADQAMYQAKQTGKNRYHIFDADQDRSVRGHHESLVHIRRALVTGELVLHYQPKVNMRSGQVIGAEALLRWQHPQRGLLLPGAFLPVVEDHALAVDVGEWVIDSALSQIERWQAEGMQLPISVNVGARQLQQLDFVDRLRHLLAAHPGVAPGALEMEVLETSALQDIDRVAQVIEACREIGIQFALDDFGTGYSSLTYLKRLAVTRLKIDQSFVRNMLDDPDDLSILGGVLSLAAAFRRQVIAEGVETVEHGSMLLQLGCELAQGYGIARPMPAGAMPAWRAAWRPPAAWSDLQPVAHADFALLFAGVEHRAWISAIESFLRGERDQLPLAHHYCRLSEWLQMDTLAQHGRRAEILALVPAHLRLHELARTLCDLAANQRNAEALARFDELRMQCDAFLAQLDMLTRNRQDCFDRL